MRLIWSVRRSAPGGGGAAGGGSGGRRGGPCRRQGRRGRVHAGSGAGRGGTARKSGHSKQVGAAHRRLACSQRPSSLPPSPTPHPPSLPTSGKNCCWKLAMAWQVGRWRGGGGGGGGGGRGRGAWGERGGAGFCCSTHFPTPPPATVSWETHRCCPYCSPPSPSSHLRACLRHARQRWQGSHTGAPASPPACLRRHTHPSWSQPSHPPPRPR